MCYGCWEEMGKPSTVTDKTKAAVSLVKRLYKFSCVGGNLHIVTDDWNLEDEHLASCRDTVRLVQAGKAGEYDDTSSEQVAVEAQILDLMEPMTEAERGAVLALGSGFIDEQGARVS